MSLFKKACVSTVLALAFGPVVAQAAPILTMVSTYAGSYNSTFSNSLGMLDLSLPANSGPGIVHQIDVGFTLTGIGASDDFANMSAVLSLGAGLTPVVHPDNEEEAFWNPVAAAGFTTNADSNNLLNAIFVRSTNAASRTRQHGEGASPTKIGSVYVTWDGSTTQFSASQPPGTFLSVYPSNVGTVDAVGMGNATFASTAVVFGGGGGPVDPPVYVSIPKAPGSANDPALPDIPYPYVQGAEIIAQLPANTVKGELVFGSADLVPDGSLFVMFWLQGDAADIQALRDQFPNAEATGAEELVSGAVYDMLRDRFGDFTMVLKHAGQASVLDGGSYAFDFSNTGVTVTAIAAVPEPATMLSLGGLAFLGFMAGRRRR